MIHDFEIRTEDMPSKMHVLLEQYPREVWDQHPGFKDRTQQWLRAHQSFRMMAKSLEDDAEALLDRSMDAKSYRSRLYRYGGTLIGNLQGHHAWEDHEYFPELSSADDRFGLGLEILEKDHQDLDVVLKEFIAAGNRAFAVSDGDEQKFYDAVGEVHPIAETIGRFLTRHLGDEEELAVPIILHHRLRG